ncbi:universal stress protein [Angustibacter sp. McL0619]|uniref:universal stress protein n=1 Tax=Angustibacter sp. McL0619 TaxID=3415676 RepID=UPI003CEED076
MTVAVAHQATTTGARALALAAREAAYRDTTLAVVHISDSLDGDIAAASKAGISDAVDKALADADLEHVRWDVHLVAGGTDKSDVAGAILELMKGLSPELLVIGARRRSPVGKAFLGSVTQTLILEADVPVLVVQEPR